MTETILLAPGANESELRRAMARFGRPSLGLRIMNGPQLAAFALMRSGAAVTEKILSREEELTLTAEALQGIAWFGKAGLPDIRGVAATLREIRQIAVDGEKCEAAIVEEALANGPFPDKNAALFEVYEKYIRRLEENGLTDGITLMRKAVGNASLLTVPLFTMGEFPLSPLENLLVQKLSGGAARQTALSELFGTNARPLKVESFRECYGIRAEAETVLGEIRTGAKALDSCLAAVTDPVSFSQLFYDLHLLYAVPVSFGCGIPIANAAPAELLELYTDWATKGLFGKESLKDLLYSEAFDRSRLPESFHEARSLKKAGGRRMFDDVLYGLRLTNDAAVNAERLSAFEKALLPEDGESIYLPALRALAEELSLPPAQFMRKYAKLRQPQDEFPGTLLHRLDSAALSEIIRELDLARETGQGGDLTALKTKIFTGNVCRESSRAGALHLCTIADALNCPRENLYVLGLSAALYPGSPRENHLLLDEDIMRFPSEPEERTSKGKVRRRQDELRYLLRLASSLGSRICLSYAGYDTAELKAANASSMLYEFFEESSGQKCDHEAFRAAVTKVGYFDHAFSEDRRIGLAVISGADVQPLESAPCETEVPVLLGLDTSYSPSALSAFYQCPRRFFLRSLLSIPEPEEEQPFEIISAAETGTLAHSLMEMLGAEKIAKEDFLQLAGEAFDRFLAKNPPLTAHSIRREKEDFLDLMNTAYEQDAANPRTSVMLAEEDIHAVHTESGVKLHGLPDRVEVTGEQNARIVDFKTMRKNDFVENDIDTCLQAVIYAFLVDQREGEKEEPIPVQGGEYRLLRLGKKTGFSFDETMKAALTDKLKAFREALEEGRFDPPVFADKEGEAEEKEICRYCKFESICGKHVERSEEGEEA